MKRHSKGLVPYKRLSWRDLLPRVLVAASALELAKQLFVIYIGNVSRFDAIYGSVSSMIVLLPWLYFTAGVVLYGTEIVGVYRHDRGQAREAPGPSRAAAPSDPKSA